jgi:hypothetical protein
MKVSVESVYSTIRITYSGIQLKRTMKKVYYDTPTSFESWGVQRCGCVTIGYPRKKVWNALPNGSVSNEFVRKKNSRKLQPRSSATQRKKACGGLAMAAPFCARPQ